MAEDKAPEEVMEVKGEEKAPRSDRRGYGQCCLGQGVVGARTKALVTVCACVLGEGGGMIARCWSWPPVRLKPWALFTLALSLCHLSMRVVAALLSSQASIVSLLINVGGTETVDRFSRTVPSTRFAFDKYEYFFSLF